MAMGFDDATNVSCDGTLNGSQAGFRGWYLSSINVIRAFYIKPIKKSQDRLKLDFDKNVSAGLLLIREST